MNNYTVITVVLCIVSFVLGIGMAIKIFAIDVSVKSIPYSNLTAITTSQIKVKYNNIAITIPSGSPIVLHRSDYNENIMHLNIALPFDETVFEVTKDRVPKYFAFDKVKP